MKPTCVGVVPEVLPEAGRMEWRRWLPLVTLLCVTGLAQAEIVIPTNSVWTFFRGTNEASSPPTAWRTNDFDDSSWEVGSAPFYYGTNYSTNIPPGTGTFLSDIYSNYNCIMMRSSFYITNTALVIGLSNRPFADDGYLLWLNGIVIRGVNLNSATNVFQPYYTNANSPLFNGTWVTLNSFTNLLRNGTNLLTIQVFNKSWTNDADFFANPETAVTYADITAPAVAAVSPPANSAATNLIQVAVTFSEAVTNVRSSDLRINGAPAATVVSNGPTTWLWGFPLPPAGLVQVTWSPAAQIKDLSANVFNATNTVWNITNIVAAPFVASAAPPFGATVSSLVSVTVTFNKPVSGVSVDDLLINGAPATGLTGSNSTYTFTFPPPSGLSVQISWDANQVIFDDAGIRMIEASNTWTYTIVDTIPPAVALLAPAANAVVGSLARLDVLFSEPVSGVDAADLLVNGGPAVSAFGSGAGPYQFEFTQPGTGVVTFAWSPGHNIRDLGAPPNDLPGGSWTVTLDPAPFAGDVVINEFAAANLLQQGALDFSEFNLPEDWIELYNQGTNPVRLLGWSLSNDPNEPGLWTFPDITLTNGQYLVVYASGLDRKTLGGTNRLHTNFKLNPFGKYLALFNAESPRRAVSEFAPEYPEQRNDYSYGRMGSNDWRYFASPTPGAANGASTITTVAPKPKLSMAHGYFEKPFPLIATCDLPGAELRYTTDGSEPAATSSLYTGPLTLSNSTVLRVSAFASNTLPSRAVSRSYLFLHSIFTQSNNPGTNFPTSFGVQSATVLPADYEMDPEILTNAAYASLVTNALLSLPVVSLMIKPYDMWDTNNGIYTHPLSRGPAWERPASIEFFTPDGSEAGFQEDGGLQIQGNASREPLKQPKHPLKMQFKGDYGPSNLKYKIFPDSPRDEFDSVNIRVDFNFSWLHWDGNQRARGQRTRDAWMKDSMRALSGLASHNRYAHLFINGLYWGVCDPSERPDASFAAAYLGGDKDDYDAVNEAHTAVDGTNTTLLQMIALPNALTTAQYDAVKQYLEITQFIDYMLLHFFVGHEDWGYNKNFYAVHRRAAGQRWYYLPWDGENILGTDVNRNDTTRPTGSASTGVPSGLHTKMATNLQYRMDFADRVHRHFFNGGALMPSNTVARWMNRAWQVDKPVILESARWGDYRRDAHAYQTAPYELYTRDNQWLTEQTRLVGTYFPQRTAIVLAQLRAQFMYPSNTAPVFNQHGGRVPEGFALTMTATNAIYYTTNGLDPRTYGTGAISPLASLYTGPVSVGQSMVVKARLLAGTNWSALNEAAFIVASLATPLRITEIMYNPVGGDAYEFLEMQNTGPTPIDIGNYNFSGVTFSFPFGTVLAAGQRIVLGNGANTNAFAARYPGVVVAGWFGGALANGGETITVLDGFGRTVLSVTYDDEAGWPTAPDGGGPSLELADSGGDPDEIASWRASNAVNGTPGAVNGSPPSTPIVLNELMADNAGAVNHEGTYPDWVELHNSTGAPVDVSGWSLSDDGNFRKFVFPGGTSIAAGGYLVVWCDAATNTTSGLHAGFALGRNGDTVSLFDPGTNRMDNISYGVQVPDYSVGRVNGSWVLTTPTPAAANTAAALAPQSALTINEWLANAVPGGDDWVELFNSSAGAPVALRNIYLGTSNALHQLRSLSFLAPRGYLQLQADELPGPDHLDFKLPAAAGAVVLYDSTGVEIQRVTYGSQVQGVSQGRLPDGGGSIVAFPGSASPGTTNFVNSYTGPVLNEVLARNSGTVAGPWGSYPDFIELFNLHPTNFPVGGMGLSDDAGTIKFTFAPGTVVPASGYLVVWCDGGRAASSSSPLNSGFALSSSGGGVYLFNGAGQLVNSIEHGFQMDGLPIGLSGGQWRLLATATPGTANAAAATLGSTAALRINEWMADPSSGNDWFELFNTDPLPVALGGLFLTDDLSLAGLSNTPIAALSFIAGGGWVKFTADQDPGQGSDHARFDLDKDGDNIRLYAPDFSIIDSLSFGAQVEGVSQGRLPDGSSNLVSFPATPTPDASNYLPLPDVVINEVLSHTDPPLEDAIEVQNTGTNTVDIGGWFISNSGSTLRKFRIPTGATLAPGAFRVFYETNFNAGGNGTNFTLNSAHGDQVYLSESDGAGNLTGYRAQVGFGAAENGVSLGRFPTSMGVDFVAMAQRTFGVDNPATVAQFRTGTGLSNGYPKIGPVIINEIMYHPVNGTNEIADEEFIELHNVTGSPVLLFDPVYTENGWQVGGGVDFTFPSNSLIAANGYVLLVNFDPATNAAAVSAFQARYGTSATLFGPLGGRLGNGGEEIALYRPDAPQQAPHPDAGFVPMILVDRVVYGDAAPWPLAADGGGASLQRLGDSLYGNEPLNWKAEPATAGATNTPSGVVAPTISGQPTNRTVVSGATAQFTVIANCSAPLGYQWQHATTNLPGATSATLIINNAQPADAGAYRCVVSNSGGSITSQDAFLVVLVPPSITAGPTGQVAVAGSTVQFTVAASGTAPLHYQWRWNSSDLPGQNSTQLTLNNVQPVNAGNYTVVVTNTAGSVTSSVALLVVNVPPFITADPTNQTVLEGGAVTFTVAATGTAPLSYQWRKDSINIPGANGPGHTISPVNVADEGLYSVVVSNVAGQVFSLPAQLTVSSQPFLANARLRPDGVFEFTLMGRSNRSYAVEWTPDFSGWTNLTNITLPGPQAPVTNPATNATIRFYRARQLP